MAVFRKSVPYDSGIHRSQGGETLNGASFQHFIYLKLDAPLPLGDHRIVWPRGALEPTAFQFSDDTTRAIALRVNQNGYSPTDLSKVAYLALWLPGGPDFGAVDFASLGLVKFEVRNAQGRIVHTGPITLRRKPIESEPGTGIDRGLLDRPVIGAPFHKAKAASFDRALILSAPGHDIGTGQHRVWLEGFTGALSAINGSQAASIDGQGRITLTGVTSISAGLSEAQLGGVRRATTSNRAGTYVYELDFSAWTTGAEGEYYIRVPGLCISDRFRVATDVWATAARTAIAGLYHHRSGIPLDGRFGTKRPASFRPGLNVTVRQSKMPLTFTTNHQDGPIDIDAGATTAWLSPVAADAGAELWGGYMDAGDWDRRIQHLEAAILLMDIHESAGGETSRIRLGLPASHEVIDPGLYREARDAPEVLHEIAWGLDFYRRLQLPDGRVRGGIESAGHPRSHEPSHLESLPVYAYAPDHVSGYRYAAAAARFARILKTARIEQLAETFRRSAMSAWEAAEAGLRDPDGFYAEALQAAFTTNALDTAGWSKLRAAMQRSATEHRTAAAGALFRLTSERRFKDQFERDWKARPDFSMAIADGAWEYLQAAGADRAFADSARRAFLKEAHRVIAPNSQSAYPALKHPYAPVGWGQGLVPDSNITQLIIRAHVLSANPAMLQALQRTSAHILGANQVGLSFTTGLGRRNVLHPLHEDHRAMGVPAPAGITIYGWAPQWMTDYHWIFGPYWSPLPDVDTRENGASRRIEPHRYALPYFEYLVEHPGIIMQQEYTVHQSLGPTAAMWLHLHAQAVRASGSRASQ